MFGDERKVNVKLLLAGLYLKQTVDRTQLSPDINNPAKKTWHTRLATDGHGGHAGMWNRMLPPGVGWRRPTWRTPACTRDRRTPVFSNPQANRHSGRLGTG